MLEEDVICHFTVYGNQENPKGNPTPYFRRTQGTKYSKASTRYHQWKDHVRNAFFEQCESYESLDGKHPFTTTVDPPKVFLKTHSWFKDKTHADPSNIHKGVEDALFKNDKYLSGEFDFDYDAHNPRVEVCIYEVAHEEITT